MGVKNIKHTMEKLLDELHKVGLKLQGQNWSLIIFLFCIYNMTIWSYFIYFF